MNIMNRLTKEEALHAALRYAKLEHDEYSCLRCRLEADLYHILVRTPYLHYTFYVEAESGEVLGLDTEPTPCPEALSLCAKDEVPGHPSAA